MVFLLSPFGPAHALQVQYAAIDLPDTTPGQNAWRYDYVVYGAVDEATGFTLLFPHERFADLAAPTVASTSPFDVAVAQPDAALDAIGLYSLTALRNIGSTESSTFSLKFTSLGALPPGAQAFQTFGADFSITGVGMTSPVPEPAAPALLFAGAALLALLTRRR